MSGHKSLLLGQADIARTMVLSDYINAVERAFERLDAGRMSVPDVVHIPAPDGAFHVKSAGSIDDPTVYQALRARLEKIEAELNLPGNRIFYLAIPPASFAEVSQGLKAAGLVRPANGTGPFSRVIVEKPIGYDLESAI